MQIINKYIHEDGSLFFTIELDDYCCNLNVPRGLLILYQLYTLNWATVYDFTAIEDADWGVSRNFVCIQSKDEIDKILLNINELVALFLKNNLSEWNLYGKIDNKLFSLTGHNDNFGILTIGIDQTHENTLMNLMYEIEEDSYYYHTFDKAIVKELKRCYNLSQMNAVKTMDKLHKYPDIMEEFIEGLHYEPFVFPETNPVKVEGYTAEELFNNYPLSELGAYNYLVYLRDKPEEAKSYLAQGLPK